MPKPPRDRPRAWSAGSPGLFFSRPPPRSGGRVHEGFDITADCGTRLDAARGGEVRKIGYDPVLYGYFVLIDGRRTSQDYFYAHLIAPPAVDRRDRVRTGEYVGRVGKTGNARTPYVLATSILESRTTGNVKRCSVR